MFKALIATVALITAANPAIAQDRTASAASGKNAKPAARAVAADGFYFEHKSDFREKVTITFVTYPNLEALNAGKDAIDIEMKSPTKRPANVTVHAFSVMMGPRCEIHMVDPAVLYQPEYIGHELLHCGLTEHFHPTQESATEK